MIYKNDCTLQAKYLKQLTEQGLEGLPALIRALVNEAMRIERENFLGAKLYQRSDKRRGYSNGYKPKTVKTRIGEVTFDIPQVREGGFSPQRTRILYNKNMAFIKKVIQSFLGPPLFVLLSGLVLFGVGAGLTYQHYRIRQNGLMTEGQVIQLDERCGDDGCTYRPVVEFNTQDRQNFTYTSSSSTNPPAYYVGETVTIYYMQENPHEACIKGEGSVLRWIFIVVGAGAVMAGFVMFAQALRDRLIAGK
ncbi:MAG: DUF3592 domain-containing protein [Anaerolineaceae bacterium]|nr:DUF3592 domain-containing protein [Anaerolineaceae bacterium]